MATREEVLTNLTKAAKQGNIRDAYRDFEELPFVDQVAISISPGIGDALAVYEIGEFGARGAKNIEEKDFLGALGNYGLSGLSAISILPLFRLFRGAKAIKAIDPVIDAPRPRKGKTGLKGPGEYQAEQAAKKTTENLPLPKVEEFKPLSLNEMVYPGTLGSTIKNQGLTSKAAKVINNSKKLPVQGKLITYLNELEKAGVPKGELRLLNILDEANEIHPKLLDEMGSKSGLDKITRQRLSQYIKTNQKDAISKRIVRNNKHSRQIKELGDEFANIKENTFHVRGITRKEFDHYSEAPHKDHFVFDSTSEFKLPNIPETEKIREFMGGDNYLNVARVQSDYAEEMGILAKNRSESQIDSIKRSIDASADRRVINNMAEYKLPSDKPGGERINMENFAIKIARENPQITSPEKLRELFIKKAGDRGATRESFGPFGNDFSIDDVFPLEAFETIQKAVEKAQKKFPVTPYIDGKAIAALKKSLDQYNDALPEINNLSLKQADLQKKINSSELTPDSPSIVDLNKELDQIKKTRDDLIGEKVVPNIDEFGGFTLSPEELKNITGKPFTESLGKSLDEIFYELEAIKPGSPAVRQKYGPGTPGERALNYFNEIVNNDKMTFDIGNGINILKRATKIKPDKFSGYPIDPYAKGTRTNYIKLPIRSNFLEAVEEGKDGMYFDSAAKRLGKEGGVESELLQGVFREGENEIDRIIRELGLEPKDYVLKPKDIEFKGPGYKFDGTYVKIDEALRKLVKEKGIDAFQAGGPVDESKLEQTERRLDAGEEIDDILKDLYGTAIANEFGEFDYKAPLRNFQDSIEKNLSNQFDFKYKDDLMDIYKSDDPGANIENRARKFSTNYINSLLDDLNLPVDVRRDNYGTNFDKIFNVAPNTNVTLDAYKSDDGDFTGDLNLRYSNRGKYGNIDLQSEINELGDTQDKIKYNQDIGPFSIQAGKTSGRDATGSVSYNLPSMSVGNAQTIQARAVVDNLLNAKGQLDYMYNNPNTGYFVNAGLGLNSQRGPEFNLKFGKNF
jgi:hypothetical protein